MEANNNRGSIILGALLLAAGVIILLGQVIGPRIGGELWPLIISAFGLAFFVAMVIGGRRFNALAIPGSIITGIGLILYMQNTFNLWETWSYAWALIICTVGIGIFIAGAWGQDPGMRRSGGNLIQLGFTLFVIFGIIFEVLFSISGLSGTGGLFWPTMLVIAGFLMLITRSYRLFRPQDTYNHEDTNLFWPVIFIGAGILWLMIRQGMLPSGQVDAVVALWPVLLVAAGINILLGRRWQWVNLLFGALVVAAMFYVVINGESLGLAARAPWSITGFSIRGDEGEVTKWITGEGEIIDRTESIGSIDEVVLRGSGELEIIQSSKPGLVISAQENLMQYIEVDQIGDRLEIGIKRGVGITTSKPIRYRLTVTDLRLVNVSGSASISAQSLDAGDLNFNLSGYGKVDIEQLAAEDLKVTVSGSGDIEMAGKVETLDVTISGAGGFDGPDLQAEDVTIDISGVGRAVVWATQSLEPHISGVGGVSYYGSPRVTKTTSGLGNITKIGDK